MIRQTHTMRSRRGISGDWGFGVTSLKGSIVFNQFANPAYSPLFPTRTNPADFLSSPVLGQSNSESPIQKLERRASELDAQIEKLVKDREEVSKAIEYLKSNEGAAAVANALSKI